MHPFSLNTLRTALRCRAGRAFTGSPGRHYVVAGFRRLVVTTLVATAWSGNVVAQAPYRLQTGRELALTGAGTVLLGAGLLLERSTPPLSPIDVLALDRQSVNGFDRAATFRWSPASARLSDVTLFATAGAAGGVALTPRVRRDWQVVGLMGLQTLLLANGGVLLVKNVVLRPRPFVLNPAAPLDPKLERDARQAFFSGHATNAFAGAVFASEVFGHYYPRSPWRPVVWGGTLALATSTALLRYDAGKHYPTDLLAGAAFGSLVGWAVPRLHEVSRNGLGRRAPRSGLRLATVQPWSNGLANGVYVRWRVSSANFAGFRP